MRWTQLKEFCNNLTEAQLEENVILWRESAEDVITNIESEQLEEDYYVNIEESENGCIPKSEAESQIKYSPEDYPNGLEHFRKVYDKGYPILGEIF